MSDNRPQKRSNLTESLFFIDKKTKARSKRSVNIKNKIEASIEKLKRENRNHSNNNKKSSSNNKNKRDKSITDKIKQHKGPLNLEATTTKNPLKLIKEIRLILEEMGVQIDKSSRYKLKCSLNGIKFSIEINIVEMFEELFVVKFYKENCDTNMYFKLCTEIFSKLQLD